MRLLLLSLILWCQYALAQFGGVQQPMFSMLSVGGGGGDDPWDTIPGKAYYWNSLDAVYTNNVATNRWIDRIQGYVVTNGNAGVCPISTSNGIFFAGTKWFTNVLLSVDNPVTLFITAKRTNGIDLLQTIISKNALQKQTHFIATPSYANPWISGSCWGFLVGASAWDACAGNNGQIATNAWITFCQTTSETNRIYYTNGVLSATIVSGSLPVAFDAIAYNGDWYWPGFITQIAIWTNILTANQISNLNYHAYKP